MLIMLEGLCNSSFFSVGGQIWQCTSGEKAKAKDVQH